MAEKYTEEANNSAPYRMYHFLQDIWPSIYRGANDLFFGFIHFIVDTLSGLWRRY